MREPLRAVDANVLLRYLLNDIRDQAEAARRLVESGRPLGLSPVALAEVAWTLTGRLYGWERQAVASGVLALLALENAVPLGFDKIEGRWLWPGPGALRPEPISAMPSAPLLLAASASRRSTLSTGASSALAWLR